jgi:hypothetical protein
LLRIDSRDGKGARFLMEDYASRMKRQIERCS